MKNQAKFLKISNVDGVAKEVKWLEKLKEGLQTLHSDEFSYRTFVQKRDQSTGCGTVCCAYGWMPRFVPEAGVKWVQTGVNNNMLRMSDHTSAIFKNINYAEISVYGYTIFGDSILRFMFFGSEYFRIHGLVINSNSEFITDLYYRTYKNNTVSFDEFFGVGMGANLNQVINRIDFCIKFLKSIRP